MAKVIQMSLKETDRYAVIRQVIERTMGQADAALWLNISYKGFPILVNNRRTRFQPRLNCEAIDLGT